MSRCDPDLTTPFLLTGTALFAGAVFAIAAMNIAIGAIFGVLVFAWLSGLFDAHNPKEKTAREQYIELMESKGFHFSQEDQK